MIAINGAVCGVQYIEVLYCIHVPKTTPSAQPMYTGKICKMPNVSHLNCSSPQGVDYVALEPVSQRIISYAYDPEHLRRVVIPQAAVRSSSPVTLSTHYRDASIYILSRQFISQIQASDMSSIKVSVLSPPIVEWPCRLQSLIRL